MPTPLGILSAHRTNTLCTRSRNCGGAVLETYHEVTCVHLLSNGNLFAVTLQLLKMNFQRYTQISFLRLILFVRSLPNAMLVRFAERALGAADEDAVRR